MRTRSLLRGDEHSLLCGAGNLAADPCFCYEKLLRPNRFGAANKRFSLFRQAEQGTVDDGGMADAVSLRAATAVKLNHAR